MFTEVETYGFLQLHAGLRTLSNERPKKADCAAARPKMVTVLVTHAAVGNNYQTAPPDPCIIPSAYSGGEGGGQALDVDFHHCRSERHGNHHDWRCE